MIPPAPLIYREALGFKQADFGLGWKEHAQFRTSRPALQEMHKPDRRAGRLGVGNCHRPVVEVPDVTANSLDFEEKPRPIGGEGPYDHLRGAR